MRRTESLRIFIIDMILIWHAFVYLIVSSFQGLPSGFSYKVSCKNSSPSYPVHILKLSALCIGE